MKTAKQYIEEGKAHELRRKQENKKQLAAGNKIYKLTKELAREQGISEEDAQAVVLETYPELAKIYYEGIKHDEYRQRTYTR